eukprot:scaffold614_cov367-Prasinococcus_capsulatus_cf.AAC.21
MQQHRSGTHPHHDAVLPTITVTRTTEARRAAYICFVVRSSPFVYDGQGRVAADLLGEGTGAGHTAYVRRHDDHVVPREYGLAVDVVYWDVKVAHALQRVDVQCDDTVHARLSQQVRHELGRDGFPLRFHLSIGTRVSKVRHYCGDGPGRRSPARVHQNEQLHERVVGWRAGGLDEVHVAPTDGFLDVYINLAVCEALDMPLTRVEAQVVADLLREPRVGGAGEHLELRVLPVGYATARLLHCLVPLRQGELPTEGVLRLRPAGAIGHLVGRYALRCEPCGAQEGRGRAAAAGQLATPRAELRAAASPPGSCKELWCCHASASSPRCKCLRRRRRAEGFVPRRPPPASVRGREAMDAARAPIVAAAGSGTRDGWMRLCRCCRCRRRRWLVVVDVVRPRRWPRTFCCTARFVPAPAPGAGRAGEGASLRAMVISIAKKCERGPRGSVRLFA